MCKSIIERDQLNDMAVLLKALDYLNLSNIHPSVSSTISSLLLKIIKVSFSTSVLHISNLSERLTRSFLLLVQKFKKMKQGKLAADAEKFKAKLSSIVENGRDSVI